MAPIIVDKEKKREEMLVAAMTVFAQKGFSNTRMADIAKKANIGKGTIYEYFKNKDDLFFALHGDIRKKFHETIFGSIREQGSASEALEKFIVATLRAFDEWQEFSFILLDFWSEHRRGKSVHLRFNELYRDSREQIAGLIQSGIKSEEFRRIDPFVTASAIIALLDGMLIQRVFEPGFFNRKEMEKQILNIIFSGIKKV